MEWVLQITLGIFAVIIAALVITNWKKIAGWGTGLRRFYHEVIIEMKKVSWPTRDEVVNSTIIVGVATVFLVIIIGAADWALGNAVGALFHVGK